MLETPLRLTVPEGNMQHQKPDRGEFYWLGAEDVAAARRLLAALAHGTNPRPVDDRPLEPGVHPNADPARAVRRAQLSLALRQRRIEVLGARFSADAPFAILLALLVLEGREGGLTVTKIARSALLGFSTTLRWLEFLAEHGFISRGATAGDRRKAHISLTEKARQGLERVFSLVD